MESIVQLCLKCGNRLQSTRARIAGGIRPWRGECDVCRQTGRIVYREMLGLAIVESTRPDVHASWR